MKTKYLTALFRSSASLETSHQKLHILSNRCYPKKMLVVTDDLFMPNCSYIGTN